MPGVDVEELRVAVYWHFATTGQAPSIADLAEDLAVQPEQMRPASSVRARRSHSDGAPVLGRVIGVLCGARTPGLSPV